MIRDALGVLVPAIKDGRLPPPPTAAFVGHHSAAKEKDPVLFAQLLARRVAEVYSLDVGMIVVAFRSDMQQAGRVELSGPKQRDFFVEVRNEFASEPGVLAAILGHEVGHIFLTRHGVHPPPGLLAEITTDTVAVLYGFGAVMADTFTVTERLVRRADHVVRVRHERHMGYLTPEEMGFVLVRSGFGAVGPLLASHAGREALRVGRKLAMRELSTPPLRRAGLWQRLVYRLLRWWSECVNRTAELGLMRPYALAPGSVQFRCVVCCQGLRVPTRKQLTATCPRCRTTMACAT